ncbi:unnamed protein product [Hymenolepis diminuta]|uniref:Uncharacterized protein n=1 Tax=Hymenolepis diminuta TaxID=6216 RepID=A0A564XUN7_HYMDI|nr:unnamed protein product [Hymenolepis diminuta]
MEGCDSPILGRFSGVFESPLSNTFMDSLQPIAQSSAIRNSTGRGNATYTINRNSENQSDSLNLLNLNNLSSKLLSFSLPNEKNSNPVKKNTKIVEEEPKYEEVVEEHQENIALDEDDLRNLENAFSELSTCPKDTGAIATPLQGTDGMTTDLRTADTDVDGLPSLSIDDGDNGNESLNGKQIQDQDENQSNIHDFDWLFARTEKEKECLSTIYEWQSRESFTSTTAYNRKAEEKLGIVTLKENTNDKENNTSVILMSATPVNSSGLRSSGVLQSSHILNSFPSISNNNTSNNNLESTNNASSNRNGSKVFDSCDGEEPRVLPVTMFSPLSSPVSSSSKRKSAASINLDESDFPRRNLLDIFENDIYHKPTAAPQTIPRSTKREDVSVDLDTSLTTTTPTVGANVSLVQPTTTVTHTLTATSGTKVFATSGGKPSVITIGNLDATSFTLGNISKFDANSFTLSNPSKSGAQNSGAPNNETNAELDKRSKHPLMATTRCLFWRSANYEHENKQHFVLRQDSDGVMRLKLEITNGIESFFLLDHRGQQIARRWRIIDLPPRLACTITVVYKPRPPLSWHTGILAFYELPGVGAHHSAGADVRPRCYVQRLIGYVGGSSIHCGICRAVDERTYWTSAFSTPQDAQDESWSFKSQPQSPTYYACVSVRNTGLRSAWIYAVAMKPNADSNISLTPLSGVSIRPSRFVLQPDQSQNVTIGICDESREIQVFFYHGDEVIRYLYKSSPNYADGKIHLPKNLLVAEGRPNPAVPLTIPKPHRRLRSAYVLCPFEGEPQEMLTEVPSTFQRDLYDWHEALVDEQRSCPPISLTIYPLLNDNAPSSSFEASSSLIVGSNLEDDVENVRMEELARLEHQSTKCTHDGQLSSSALVTSGNRSIAKEMVQLSLVSATAGQEQQSSSMVYDDLQLYKESTISSMKQQGEETASYQPPLISIRPESQLIFAPWNYKKPTTGILELKLSLPEVAAAITNNISANTTGSTTTTSSATRRRRSKTWRLYWSARPVAETKSSVFSILLPAIPLTVQAEQTHYFAFRFEPPHSTPPGSRFEERWVLTFQFSEDITGSLLANSMSTDKPTQSVEVLFVATTASDAAVAPPTKKVIAPKLPVKIKKTPLLFQGESQELQCEIVNISEQRVIITVGSCSSPLFELVKPTVHKFYIDPQYSVRLSIRCRMENAPRESNEKELSATLILNCALESDRSNKQKISIPMKAIL